MQCKTSCSECYIEKVLCQNAELTRVHCTFIFGWIVAVDLGRTLHLAHVFLTSMFTGTICKIIVDVLHYDLSTNGKVCYGEQSVAFRTQFIAERYRFVDVRPQKGK